MASRLHRRNDGTSPIHFPQFRAMLEEYLPDAMNRTNTDTRPASLRWVSMRLRPEVHHAVAVLIERHETLTGQRITQSEIIAAAFNLALPVLVSHVFPRGRDA